MQYDLVKLADAELRARNNYNAWQIDRQVASAKLEKAADEDRAELASLLAAITKQVDLTKEIWEDAARALQIAREADRRRQARDRDLSPER